jgi:uncharacterized protein (UPF0305 family)
MHLLKKRLHLKLDVEALQNQLIDKLNTALTEKINNLKFASVKEVESLKSENATLKEALTDLVSVVEKFAATPSEEPKRNHTTRSRTRKLRSLTSHESGEY